MDDIDPQDTTAAIVLYPGDGTAWRLTDALTIDDVDILVDHLNPLQRRVFAARLRGWADRLDRNWT